MPTDDEYTKEADALFRLGFYDPRIDWKRSKGTTIWHIMAVHLAPLMRDTHWTLCNSWIAKDGGDRIWHRKSQPTKGSICRQCTREFVKEFVRG